MSTWQIALGIVLGTLAAGVLVGGHYRLTLRLVLDPGWSGCCIKPPLARIMAWKRRSG